MRLHSDIITPADIHAATPDDVSADVMQHGSRKRLAAWEVSLTGYGARHTRKKNSGQYGAGYEYAASWDDWGVWLAALYEIDPNMDATYYKDRDDFYASTTRYIPKGMRAPWLTQTAPIEWPDAEQQATDTAALEKKRKQQIRDEARQLKARADRLLSQL